ncbi:hypothetical protein OQA88_10571 [Cercophora sp. LCS_1]
MASADWASGPFDFFKFKAEPTTAEFSKPPRKLGCPYRKRDPLGFNIRDARQCCEGFVGVSDVINHVRSFHDRHEDGMPYLPSPLGRPDAETWSMVYKALFSNHETPPTPDHCFVVEHIEYYQIQNLFLVTFADHLEEAIDTKQLSSSPIDYIMELVQHFVDTTFHFATQYGLDLLKPSRVPTKGTARSCGDFVKKEAEREEAADLCCFASSAFKPNTKVKEEEYVVKKESADAPNSNWKDIVGVTERREPTEPNAPALRPSTPPVRVEVIDLTGIESSACSEEADASIEDAETPVGSQGPSSDGISSCDAAEDDTQDRGDAVPERQLREVLNFAFHNALGVDLDSIVNSRLLYDTLIDLVADFIFDLTEAAANCNEATAGSYGDNGAPASRVNLASGPFDASPRTFPSSRERPGNRDDGRDDNGDGKNRRDTFGKPPTAAKPTRREIRLPCPFRMMFPRTFNVREHYSCSMTYFPTIGRLKDHLREHHKRTDGVEVLCSRCFAGFKSRDDLHQHCKATIVCEPAEFDPTAGLHGEAVNLLRGREKTGQDYLQQWRDICKIVFQNDHIIPMPEYHAVMEHFEFAEVFFRHFGELSRHLRPSISPEEENLVHTFGSQAADTLFGWYHLGLDHCQPWSQITETVTSGDARYKDYETLTVYCIKTLQRLAEISWATQYENDGSRGRGNRRARAREDPPGRLPTPTTSQGASSLLVSPNQEGERGQKRRRLAPIPTPAPQEGYEFTPKRGPRTAASQFSPVAAPGVGPTHRANYSTSYTSTKLAFPERSFEVVEVEMDIPKEWPPAHNVAPDTNSMLPSPQDPGPSLQINGHVWEEEEYWLQNIPEFLTKLNHQAQGETRR